VRRPCNVRQDSLRTAQDALQRDGRGACIKLVGLGKLLDVSERPGRQRDAGHQGRYTIRRSESVSGVSDPSPPTTRSAIRCAQLVILAQAM
jgi:hypothetical protein